MKTEQLLLLGGAGIAAYMLLKPHAQTIPGSGTTIPVSTGSGGTTVLVGKNSGVRGGNGSFYTVSNYNQLLQANPNLGNPQYQMTSSELAQYLANYSDLQQGLPSWVGQKDPTGNIMTSLTRAEQVHWQYHGCAEQRIFLPLQPPSTANYIPPPPNTNTSSGSSGGGWLSSALGIATTVIGLLGEPAQLNNADAQALFTMSAIIKDILPLYASTDPLLTRAIEVRMNTLLIQYS